MRYDQISVRESYEIASFAQEQAKADSVVERALQPLAFQSEAAMPDVPLGVGRMIVACYVAMVIVFALGTGGGRDINFVLTIVALFVALYFTVPRILLGVDPRTTKRPSLDRFLSEGMTTCTGRTGGAAALAQILIVPICLVLAAFAMSVVVRWFL